jgi:tetratricopeptide (TPR) repeat protein
MLGFLILHERLCFAVWNKQVMKTLKSLYHRNTLIMKTLSKYHFEQKIFCVCPVDIFRFVFLFCVLISPFSQIVHAQLPTDSEGLLKSYNKDTNNMEVLSLLAQSYEHSDPNLARTYASKITEKKKVSFDIQARAYNTLANCALVEGDLDEAESFYLKAIELVVEGERVWFSAVYQSSLAQVYLNRGELKKAVFTYQEAQRTLEVADHEQVNDVFNFGILKE